MRSWHLLRLLPALLLRVARLLIQQQTQPAPTFRLSSSQTSRPSERCRVSIRLLRPLLVRDCAMRLVAIAIRQWPDLPDLRTTTFWMALTRPTRLLVDR